MTPFKHKLARTPRLQDSRLLPSDWILATVIDAAIGRLSAAQLGSGSGVQGKAASLRSAYTVSSGAFKRLRTNEIRN